MFWEDLRQYLRGLGREASKDEIRKSNKENMVNLDEIMDEDEEEIFDEIYRQQGYEKP